MEKYKVQNQSRYKKKFHSINQQIEDLIRLSHDNGNMEQEIKILQAIKNGFRRTKLAGNALTAEFFRLNFARNDTDKIDILREIFPESMDIFIGILEELK